MSTQDVEYEVLVSCVDDDSKWAKKLVKRLRDEKVPTRLNDRKMPISQQLRAWINGAAPKGQKLIAVCSHPYLDDAQSRQMIDDFRLDQKLRLAGERLLIPVMINGCSPPDEWKDLPALDFSNERDFELRFGQLLEALDWHSERQDGFLALPAMLISRILGRKEESGEMDFAEGVAEIYRMLDWEVNQGRQFDSSSSELVITKTEAGIRTKAFVECHGSVLSPNVCGRIVERAQQTPHAHQRIVITSHPVPSDLETYLIEAKVNCILYTKLLYDLVPLGKYAAKIIEEFDEWRADHWENNDWFIRPDVTTDESESRQSALEHIARWLGNKQARHLAILGDLGTGKTTLMRFLAYELAKAFLNDPLRHPAPVFIELKDVRKEVSLKSVIIQHFDEKGVNLKGTDRFDRLVETGRIILLFDAFDEMADRLHDDNVKMHNLTQLLKPSEQGGKIVITSRTHYFKNYDEQVRLLKQEADYVYLAEFTEDQVREYLAKARPKTKDSDWKLINGIYSLAELVRRPLFMDLVVKKLPLPGKHAGLNSARLYTDYVELWVKREKSKQRRLVSETRIGLMEELAWLMWSEQINTLRYDEAMAFTEGVVGAGEFRFGSLGPEEVAGELCTASFLNRDDAGNFSFYDRSFQEYFVARRFYKYFLDPDRHHHLLMEMLAVRPLEQKIVFFLTQLDEIAQMRL